ncbi:hypothetical protein PHET_05575 [Paragonimus heterotremus]|uniref:Serpin domain-containing protein n=1 Tax=Paragonimus heterotremus TaxID=100268 RepID=A0A8J4SXK1_9TREM|nr:hypothetical protein PHET_05575 [Paragonimus heterotremus]
MMLIGGRGNTRREIASAMTFPESLSECEILTAISDISDGLTNSRNIDVSFANRVYIFKKLQISKWFTYALHNYLEDDLIRLPNNVHYETSRKEVNKWVEEQTHGMTNELLPTRSINQETRMIAVNALYFKGIWKKPFSDSETYEASFHLLDGTKQNIQMMKLKHQFAFHKFRNLNARAIRIPFSHALWEMVFVLPDKRDGLPQLLEQSRRPGVLQSILSSSYQPRKLSLLMPKFTLGLSGSVDAKVILNTMGIRDLFSLRTANLSGITVEEPLAVSNLFHKAVLKVDEKGATAAAATAVVISLRSMSFKPNFRADHSFMVMLVYNKTVPAFIGHCVEPERN